MLKMETKQMPIKAESAKEVKKLLTRLKRKHGYNQKTVAYIIDIQASTLSSIIHGHQGNTGETRVLPELKWLVGKLEGRPEPTEDREQENKILTNRELKQDGLWKCPKCGVLQKPHDINNPYCLDRSCNKKL